MQRMFQFLSAIGCSLTLLACSHGPMTGVRQDDSEISAALPSPTLVLPVWMRSTAWQHQSFPGKRRTLYSTQTMLGREALAAEAISSMSVMRKRLRVEPQSLGSLKFSWLAKNALSVADVSKREFDDAPLRVVLSFEGDRSKFSAKNHMLSELALALTGEDLPYATLMYVWCNKRQAGELITNPRTDRIRKIVLESGSKNLGQWLDYERDIRADFIKAFGEEPGALTGIALMTDTDNTQSTATAWYGPVSFTSLPSSKASR